MNRRLSDPFKAWPQYWLPHHALSRLMHRLTRVRVWWFKDLFIRTFSRLYGINLSQAVVKDIKDFEHFNAFFTRALEPTARPIDHDGRALVSPVDGTISQVGTIEQGQLIQAKGMRYSVARLLVADEKTAAAYEGGRFACIYLSPSNYHRIHMPLQGTLRQMRHVPGRLFSVNPATTRMVPGLFARNERVVAQFDSPAGDLAMVLVGAIFVASIETVWAGEVTPPRGRKLRQWAYTGAEAITLDKGAEMGRFNMGSTVIMLLPPGRAEWDPTTKAGDTVLMGQRLGRLL